jgi:carbonic anhydrase
MEPLTTFPGTANANKYRFISRYLQESHQRIFENNKTWVASKLEGDQKFFDKLAKGQNPDYL